MTQSYISLIFHKPPKLNSITVIIINITSDRMRVFCNCENAEEQAETYKQLLTKRAMNCKSLVLTYKPEGSFLMRYRVDVAYVTRILKNNKRLEKFILDCRMENEYVWRILESLVNNENLRELGLLRGPLDDLIGYKLKHVLDTNKNLATLRLNGISLTNKALNVLGDSIQNSTSLLHLDLNNNNNLFDVNSLFQIISNNKSLLKWEVHFRWRGTGNTSESIINLLNTNNTLLSLNVPCTMHAEDTEYLKRLRNAVINNKTIQSINLVSGGEVKNALLDFDDGTGFSIRDCLNIRKAKNTTLANLCSKLITEKEIEIPEGYPKVLIKMNKPIS